MTRDENLYVLNHPVVLVHLSRLRDKETNAEDFRTATRRLTQMLAIEATRDISVAHQEIQTPITKISGRKLAETIAIVPILRAGLAMEASLLDLIPDARVWHLGLYRNEETKQPVEYYQKFPMDNPPDTAFIVDPMVATGGSICAALDILLKWGVKRIKVLGLIGAPEGIQKIRAAQADVQIYLAALDECLNENAYIVPGLGDAGDRIYNSF